MPAVLKTNPLLPSDQPESELRESRAGRALAAAVVGLLSYFVSVYDFAVVYLYLSRHQDNAFSGEQLNVISALYFSMVTAMTLGYGDITPKTSLGMVVVMLQLGVNFLYVILVFSVLAAAVREAFKPSNGG